MPADIRAKEQRTADARRQLESEQPNAFHRIVVDGQPLHYVSIGDDDRPVVLFIHGSPGRWDAWAEYLRDPELRRRARLIAVDRPGFGGSGSGRVERSLEAQSRAIAAVLEHVRPRERVVVVGHSFGGPVAVRLAIDLGPRVTDLVLLAGSIDPAQERTAWYQVVAEWPVLSALVPRELQVTNREIRALRGELTAMLPLWDRITQRVTVVQGALDTLVPAANADFAARQLRNARAVEIIRLPNGNHFLPWNHYERVRRIVLDHMRDDP